MSRRIGSGFAQIPDFLGRRLTGKTYLSADLLQANSADEGETMRVPTAMVIWSNKGCCDIYSNENPPSDNPDNDLQHNNNS
jgi:hypothetical protein